MGCLVGHLHHTAALLYFSTKSNHFFLPHVVLALHCFVFPLEFIQSAAKRIHLLDLAVDLVLALVALCFGDHGFVAKAVKLLLDQVEPFGYTCTAAGYHWTVVVDSRHEVSLA